MSLVAASNETETSSSHSEQWTLELQVLGCAVVVACAVLCLMCGAVVQILVKRWCYDRGRRSMLPMQSMDEDCVVEDGREFHLVPVSAPTSLTELVQEAERHFTVMEEVDE